MFRISYVTNAFKIYTTFFLFFVLIRNRCRSKSSFCAASAEIPYLDLSPATESAAWFLCLSLSWKRISCDNYHSKKPKIIFRSLFNEQCTVSEYNIIKCQRFNESSFSQLLLLSMVWSPFFVVLSSLEGKSGRRFTFFSCLLLFCCREPFVRRKIARKNGPLHATLNCLFTPWWEEEEEATFI